MKFYLQYNGSNTLFTLRLSRNALYDTKKIQFVRTETNVLSSCETCAHICIHVGLSPADGCKLICYCMTGCGLVHSVHIYVCMAKMNVPESQFTKKKNLKHESKMNRCWPIHGYLHKHGFFVTVNNGHTMAQTEFHKYTTVNKSCTNFLRDTTEN